MTIQVTKESIDIGIVARDGDALVEFYRNVMGLTENGEMSVGSGVVRFFGCGTSSIKVMILEEPPPKDAADGGIAGATGYRYWTVATANLEEIVENCRQRDLNVVMEPSEVRPGIVVALICDPDGNLIELVRFLDSTEGSSG